MTVDREIAVDSRLEIGRAFAEAYAHGDLERLETLLSPDLVHREVNPGGYIEITSAQGAIEQVRDYLAEFDRHEVLDVDVDIVGDRVRAVTRWRLLKGDESWLLEWTELCRVGDGRITERLIACSGRMPEAG